MNKNRKIHIIKIGVAIFVLLVLILTYFSFYSKIKLLSGQIGSAERSIMILEEKRRDLDTAAVVLAGLESEVGAIKSAFLSEENFPVFINTLEDFGRNSGAKFTAKEANFPANESSQAELSFSLKGQFENIFRFLHLLDNSQYSGVLKKIFIYRDGDDSTGFSAEIDYLIFNFRL